MTQRILLVDDHHIVRAGLKAILAPTSYQVVAEASSGEEALSTLQSHEVDLIIMDISMPGMDGIESTGRVKELYPEKKVLALSLYSDKRYVRQILKKGASGYLVKDCAGEQLIGALDAIVAGQVFLSPAIAQVVLQDYVGALNQDQEKQRIQSLTERERETLLLLVDGRAIKEIATELHLSRKTVESHRKQIFSKLKIDNLPDLVKFAIRHGLIQI